MTSARSFGLSRGDAVLAISALAASACSTPAYAQAETSYPVRPLRLIVPFAPGGTTDTVARLVAREATKSLGQSIVVENRPGAGGLIGAEAVLKLPPDGYTLAFATISTLAVLPLAQTKPSYDPLRDFAHGLRHRCASHGRIPEQPRRSEARARPVQT
jgi:tripartite-type tricarboxylate transporter receptor subunit TctC